MTINPLNAKYSAVAAGVLNKETFALAGHGQFDFATGRVVGLYEIETLNADIDKLFFNAILITGYPSVSIAAAGAHNPFVSRDYSYIRSLTFSTGQQLRYFARCVWEEGTRTLRSSFEVEGEVPILELNETLPIIETWEPVGDHEIRGGFSILWRSRDGGLVDAQASTLYNAGTGEIAPGLKQFREIQINNPTTPGRTLRVDQTSSLKPMSV